MTGCLVEQVGLQLPTAVRALPIFPCLCACSYQCPLQGLAAFWAFCATLGLWFVPEVSRYVSSPPYVPQALLSLLQTLESCTHHGGVGVLRTPLS